MTRDLVPTEPRVQELKFHARGVGPLLSVHTDGAGGRAALVRFIPGAKRRAAVDTSYQRGFLEAGRLRRLRRLDFAAWRLRRGRCAALRALQGAVELG